MWSEAGRGTVVPGRVKWFARENNNDARRRDDRTLTGCRMVMSRVNET